MILQIKNAPTSVEPGVNFIEVEMAVFEEDLQRDFPATLCRIEPNKKTAAKLPMLVDVKHSHIFSVSSSVEESALLVQYDSSGCLYAIYTRDETGYAWERSLIPSEYVGKTIRQFSARYMFQTPEARNEFMRLVAEVVAEIQTKDKPSVDKMRAAFKILSKSRVGPVSLPVTVAQEVLNASS